MKASVSGGTKGGFVRMASIHTYRVRGDWSGGRTSVGSIEGSNFNSPLSIPVDLGGPGVGTSPEELLLGAAYGCYLITLSTLLSNRNVPFTKISLESQGFVVNDRGLRFDRIEHYPTIYVDGPVDEEQISFLAQHAEHACMVSSALRGNVEVRVHPRVAVQAPN
jgi:peroxiredoxin-like protein